MLSPHQLRWGVDQWSAYLKNVEIPIMPRSRYLLQAVMEGEGETVSPKELVGIVTGDPFLALRLLRTAEKRRSRTLGHETTTPLASIMQIGMDDVNHIVRHSPLCDDQVQGLVQGEFRASTASFLARNWAGYHADVSPEEVALAALLADVGEMLMWHFVPELPMKVSASFTLESASQRAQAEQDLLGFSFKSLTLALAQAWDLPPLLTALIRGADTVRAKIARIASQAARHLQIDPEHPGLVGDIRELTTVMPSVSPQLLAMPLPIMDDFRDFLLKSLEEPMVN